jgi:Domain of unknown function (DUF4258)
MFSTRFARPVVITAHAVKRMGERHVSDALLLSIIDSGHTKYSDANHLWAWAEVPGRDDNLVCAVLVLENVVVVKTVMHRWELQP